MKKKTTETKEPTQDLSKDDTLIVGEPKKETFAESVHNDFIDKNVRLNKFVSHLINERAFAEKVFDKYMEDESKKDLTQVSHDVNKVVQSFNDINNIWNQIFMMMLPQPSAAPFQAYMQDVRRKLDEYRNSLEKIYREVAPMLEPKKADQNPFCTGRLDIPSWTPDPFTTYRQNPGMQNAAQPAGHTVNVVPLASMISQSMSFSPCPPAVKYSPLYLSAESLAEKITTALGIKARTKKDDIRVLCFNFIPQQIDVNSSFGQAVLNRGIKLIQGFQSPEAAPLLADQKRIYVVLEQFLHSYQQNSHPSDTLEGIAEGVLTAATLAEKVTSILAKKDRKYVEFSDLQNIIMNYCNSITGFFTVDLVGHPNTAGQLHIFKENTLKNIEVLKGSYCVQEGEYPFCVRGSNKDQLEIAETILAIIDQYIIKAYGPQKQDESTSSVPNTSKENKDDNTDPYIPAITLHNLVMDTLTKDKKIDRDKTFKFLNNLLQRISVNNKDTHCQCIYYHSLEKLNQWIMFIEDSLKPSNANDFSESARNDTVLDLCVTKAVAHFLSNLKEKAK